jgi:hypothetical protein
MTYYNYFTEIEEHFVRRRGKHLLISPMDWGLIAAWRDAGIPLQVALRGIDIAMDSFSSRQRGGSKVNTLAYCHDSVLAEYAGHLESHIGESLENGEQAADEANRQAGKEDTGTPHAIEFIAERICEIKNLESKQWSAGAADEIRRVRERLEEVSENLQGSGRIDSETLERDLTIIDDLLVRALRTLIPADQMIAWESEEKKDLKVYKKNLPKEMYEKIRANFIRDKIHRNFSIGELSIFRL